MVSYLVWLMITSVDINSSDLLSCFLASILLRVDCGYLGSVVLNKVFITSISYAKTCLAPASLDILGIEESFSVFLTVFLSFRSSFLLGSLSFKFFSFFFFLLLEYHHDTGHTNNTFVV